MDALPLSEPSTHAYLCDLRRVLQKFSSRSIRIDTQRRATLRGPEERKRPQPGQIQPVEKCFGSDKCN